MSEPNHQELAQSLLRAEQSGDPIAPLTRSFPGLSQHDAYAIQQHQIDHWVAQGRRIAGYKVGLTSTGVQQQLGVDQPDFGRLFGDRFHLSGAELDSHKFISPRIEPEIAFVLNKPLSGNCNTVAEVIGAVDYAIAALEIVDSRIEDWNITISDTIADNASSAAVVLGSIPVDIRNRDFGLVGSVVRKNGAIVETGAGAAVLGNPLASVTWLANTLGSLGTTLEAGSVVMSGAFTNMISVAECDVISADFAGLGSVTAAFSPASQ
ncbi:2-keto-4-pentenoate hydratase [Rothia uropygialis]|uniref:2-keto-4-pentenoate hydratase n=1 Tax=Kocuria sp. 36 TaxID=1415402 RepID=UPI00101B8C24|nr:2-keto-4-pentenoate hydratase [Kocuria sp. 36]